ncbi:MAG: ABC transporter substrate-binding protein, partial [Mariprofundaceae bacterium]
MPVTQVWAAHADAPPVTIQLKWKHQFQFAGYYAALEKGFYADEGLNVRLIEGGPAHAPVAELLEGKVDYAVADAGILLDRAAGKDVKVLASIFQQSPQVLYTRDDVASVADLRGKRVMLQDGFLTIEVLAMLQHFGISQADFIRQPIGDIEDLISGRTDAFPGCSTNESFMLGQRGIPYRIYKPRDYGIDFYGDTLITTGRELAGQQKRALAVRRASLRGWAYALKHPGELVQLIRAKYDSQHKSAEH